MVNTDDVTKENNKKLHPNWLQFPDHLYKIWRTGGSIYGKAKLFNLISQ